MTILKNRQEYNPELHGNVFDFIVQESRRLRFWQRPQEPELVRRPQMQSLRGNNGRNALYRFQANEPSANKTSENVFELAGARKL